MTTFEYKFLDGRKKRVKASYYKKERNPRSEADEYVFYSEEDEVLLIVPALWLDIDGSPKEV